MGVALFVASLLLMIAGMLALLGGSKGGGAAALVAGSVLLLLDCFTVVPARSVGVVVSFGKTIGTENSGIHMVRPWAKVEKFPATVNTLRLVGNGKGDDADGPCVTVRLANQTTACVDLTVQWQLSSIDKKAIEALYVRWRSFGNIEPNLVRPQTQHAILLPFEGYDPLRVLNGDDKPSQTTADLEATTKAALQQAVGAGITINTVTFNLVHYDDTTQSKLNAYAQALADTRIAEQRQKTAAAQKAANDALASGSATQPGVLYQNCLDMVERLVKDGKALPAAFSCGSSDAPVVVSAK